MAVKLLPPVIEGKIPAQTGNQLKIPFQHSRGVGPGAYSHFILKIKTSSTGQQLGLVKSEGENQKNSVVLFNLKETNIDLIPGQYYKAQLAYVNNEDEIGHFSTIGIFKYTTYPKIYITADEGELTRQGASANSELYTGVYQQESYTIFNTEALKNGIETIKKLREERTVSIKKYLGLSESISEEDKIKELEEEKEDKELILKLYEVCIEDLKNIIKSTEKNLEENEKLLEDFRDKIIEGEGNPSDENYIQSFDNFITEITLKIKELDDFIHNDFPQEEFNNALNDYRNNVRESITQLSNLLEENHSETLEEYITGRVEEIKIIESQLSLYNPGETNEEELGFHKDLSEYEATLDKHINTVKDKIESDSSEHGKKLQNYIAARQEEIKTLNTFFNLGDVKDLALPDIKKLLDNLDTNLESLKILYNKIAEGYNSNITDIRAQIKAIITTSLNPLKTRLESIEYKEEQEPSSTDRELWQTILLDTPNTDSIEHESIINSQKALMQQVLPELEAIYLLEEDCENYVDKNKYNLKIFYTLLDFLKSVLSSAAEALKNEDYITFSKSFEESKTTLSDIINSLEDYSNSISSAVSSYYKESLEALNNNLAILNIRFYNETENTNSVNTILTSIRDMLKNFNHLDDYKEYLDNKERYLEELNDKELFNITNYGPDRVNFKDEALKILETYNKSEETQEDINIFINSYNNLLSIFEIIPLEEIEAELELQFKATLKEIENNDPLKLSVLTYFSVTIPKILNNNTTIEYRDKLKNIFISYEQNKNISNAKKDLEAISNIAYEKGYYSLLKYFKEELKDLDNNFISFLSNFNYINSIIEELNTINNLPSIDEINITENTTDKEYEEKFQIYLYSPGERQYLDKKLLFNTIGDNNEKVYSYCFNIYKGDELFETSGELIHDASKDTEANISYDSYTIVKELEDYIHYSIQYVVTTGNNLKAYSPRYLIAKTAEKKMDLPIEIIIPNIESSNDKEVEQALLNKEEGYFTVGLKFNQITSIQGQYRILRADNLSNYNVWTEMAKFKIDDYIQPGSYYWMFDDFTVQHGISYVYAIQQFGGKIYSEKKLSRKVICDFIDTFLYDGERQLKIQFNPKVSSFKNTLLESKLDTIGGTHPFIFRNAQTNYKEIPISGLISYLMDNNQMFLTDKELMLESKKHRDSTIELEQQNEPIRSTNLTSENILSERIFKLEVLNWLTNGQPKLFRSPAEGNYIVRLLNVSLSPNDTLGRMLHTFTATGYEIAANTPDNLKYYNFIKNSNFENKIRTTHHYNYNFINKAKGTKISFEPSTFARFTNMTPWTELKLIYDSGEESIIQIGLTGQYNVEQAGLISVEVISENLKEGNLEIYIQNQNFDQIIENLEIIDDNNLIKQNFVLQEVRSKDYYIQVTSNLDLKDFTQENNTGVNNSDYYKKVLFGSDFFKDRINETTGELIRSSLNNIIFLRIESKPINVTNEQNNKLKTSLYIEPELYESLAHTSVEEQKTKDVWREYFYYTLEDLDGEEPPKKFLDYGIIEGKPYKIPTRIPTGYIEFTAEDFSKPIIVTLGPGVYADVCYRVIEQVYKPIDIGIKEEVINVL